MFFEKLLKNNVFCIFLKKKLQFFNRKVAQFFVFLWKAFFREKNWFWRKNVTKIIFFMYFSWFLSKNHVFPKFPKAKFLFCQKKPVTHIIDHDVRYIYRILAILAQRSKALNKTNRALRPNQLVTSVVIYLFRRGTIFVFFKVRSRFFEVRFWVPKLQRATTFVIFSGFWLFFAPIDASRRDLSIDYNSVFQFGILKNVISDWKFWKTAEIRSFGTMIFFRGMVFAAIVPIAPRKQLCTMNYTL